MPYYNMRRENQSTTEYISQLETIVKKQDEQIERLTNILVNLKKKTFGSSNEKTTTEDCAQLSFFDEAETESVNGAAEPTVEEVRAYHRKKQVGKREEILKNLPIEIVECQLPEAEQVCPKCETKLKVIGKEVVRTEVELISARLVEKQYVRDTYACPQCEKETGSATIEKAPVPAPFMKRSLASPSAVAHIMYQKYVNAVPLYRQEKDWAQIGFALSRATMANWIIRTSREWLFPL